MLSEKIQCICEDKRWHHISWLAFVCSCVSMLNIVRIKMDFPSPNSKAAFVICFTLAFESTGFEGKTMRYFASGF